MVVNNTGKIRQHLRRIHAHRLRRRQILVRLLQFKLVPVKVAAVLIKTN
jgi:CRP-like cAMP-binding protein